MKIAIITGHSCEFTYKQIQLNNLTEYCNRWGYTLITHYEPYKIEDRDPWWNKLHFVQQSLADFDWVLWIDSDAIFTNMTIPITDLIDNVHDIVVTLDTDGEQTGSLLFYNSQYTYNFLERWFQLGNAADSFWTETPCTAIHNDNTVLTEWLQKDDIIRTRVKFIEPIKFVTKHVHFPANPGAFIMHVPGSTKEDKLEFITKFLNNIVR